MSWSVFATYNGVGAAGLVGAGDDARGGLGRRFPAIGHDLTPVLALVIAASVLPILIELRRARRRAAPDGISLRRHGVPDDDMM
jgi:hypothetical protein